MHDSNILDQEIEEKIEEDIEDKRSKILKLYESIQLLKEVISSKILKDLKICKKSCEDANIVIGELNGNGKKQ